jgi:glycosyltransferase involved in cell wall biosynthesis
MNRALIVHYHFLPVHNVAVKRLVGYAKHLPTFGWRTLVLTREWRGIHEADPSWGLSWEPELERDSGCTVHRVPHPTSAPPRAAAHWKALRVREAGSTGPARGAALMAKIEAKRLRMGRMLFGDYPDEFVSWVPLAVEAGVELARRERVDVIMSSCPPETNHVVGHQLSRHLGVPWVAFFGDMYGFLDAALPAYSIERLLRTAWHRRCLARAAACAAVSPAMVEYLERSYGKPAHLVLTGVDPDEFPQAADKLVSTRDRLVVSHVGSVYPGDQRPDIFFDGLDMLLTQKPEIAQCLEVRFVGSKCDDRLHAMLEGRPAAHVCTIEPKVDSTTAISLVSSSDALLAFTCTAHRDRHGTMSYPTKIFEAIAARRPVLSVPADGDWVDELLARTGGGTSARDGAEVADQLQSWFASWSRDGSVPFHGHPAEIAALSLDRQVEHLARLFDSVCSR